MAVRETEQACEVRGGHVSWRVRRVRDTDSAWRRVELVLVRQKLQMTRGGACEVFSGCSYLGFARDCLFCYFMPLL